MKMNTILSGNHYMMVANKIYEEYFTCNHGRDECY